jgi:DNA (cytosine-5)-methyltransferase 1
MIKKGDKQLMTESISMIELFSGVGAQERALRQLGLPYEVKHTCDCDASAVLSYAAMRWDLDKEMETFDFPSQEQMIEELQAKNLGFDFQKEKHTITKRTPITKLKQYYIADKLSNNLGDISKVERLPRANFVTYSSPCQSFSVAGKLAGAAKTCTKCGHKWDIDFSNPDYNYKCPKCGNASLESTTSGLLQEVQRLLSVAYEENELPEYLMLENVKNLVGKKFIGQFTAWVRWLDSIGYNTYYKVLNAKNYGIPQNRERVFAISIRKDIDTNGYTFPEQIPLTIRLKDILEKSVDEKYYLPDERIEKILNSTFVQEKKRIQMTDVCDTLLARDYKDPKCVQVEAEPEVKQLMNIMPTKTRDNPNQGRVYDVDGLAPTLTKMDGGNREPFIVEEKKSLWTDTQKQMITDDGNIKRYVNSDVVDEFNVGDCADISFPNGYNKANRVFDGYSPAINGTTTQSSFIVKEPIVYDDYNSRVSADQDTINTLTTNCGASAERNGVKIIEKTVIIEDQFPGSRDARIYENYSPTLRQNCGGLEVANGEVEDKIEWRIRKLTDKECWRLMGFTDEDNDRAATYVSPSARYKQAGNSICTCCLIALFSSLFIEDGHRAEVWTKHMLHFDD